MRGQPVLHGQRDGRRPEHRADLPGGVVDAGPGARLAAVEVGRRGGGQGCPHEAVGDAEQGGREQQLPQRHVGAQHGPHPHERHGVGQQADPGEGPRVGLCDEAADDGCQAARDDRHRRHEQGGVGRREPPHALRPDHDREHRRGDREAHGRDGDVGHREVAVAEETQRHERLGALTRLPDDERDHHEHAEPDEAPHRDRPCDRGPVVAVPLLDAEDDAEETHRGQHDPDPVEPVRVGVEGGDEPPGEHHGEQAHRDVDEEDPLPPEGVDEHATEDRADERRHPGDGAPQAHGLPARLRREEARDHRHRLRAHERGPEALDHAGDDEPGDGAGQSAPQGREGEDREPDEVDALGAVAVTEPPGDEQGDGVGEQVGAGHPHRRADVGVQPGHERGHRDGHDRGVDQDHEEPQAQGPQRRPRARGARVVGGSAAGRARGGWSLLG